MVDNLHTIIFSFVYLRVLEPLWHSIFATKAQRHEVITKKNIANINHVLEFNVQELFLSPTAIYLFPGYRSSFLEKCLELFDFAFKGFIQGSLKNHSSFVKKNNPICNSQYT